MRGKILACWLALVFIGLHPCLTSAQITRMLPPDARSRGMGMAFTALAEGPSACFWNPGALGLLDGLYLSPVSYAEIAPHFLDNAYLIAGGLAAGSGGWGGGVNINYLSLGQDILFDESGELIDDFRAWEYEALLGGGVDLFRLISGERRNIGLGLGMNLSMVHQKLGEQFWLHSFSDSLSGATAFNLDAGLLGAVRIPLATSTQPPNTTDQAGDFADYVSIRFGLAMQNLLNKEIRPKGSSDGELMEQRMRIGIAAEAALFTLPSVSYLGPLFRGTLSADVDKSATYSSEHPIVRVGAEAGLFHLIALRLGYINDKSGDIKDKTYGVGLGVDLRTGPPGSSGSIGGRIDFASVPQALELDRVNQVGLSLWARF